MATDFRITVDPTTGDVAGRLEDGAAALEDFRDFWPSLAASLAAATQNGQAPTLAHVGRRHPWPRRDFRANTRRVRFGTRVFYGAYSQFGTRHQAKRVLLSIDEARRDRAASSVDAGTADRQRSGVAE